MGKNSAALVLMFFIGAVFAVSASGAQTPRRDLLRDGFSLAGVDGKLIIADSNEQSEGSDAGARKPDRWFFELASDVSDDRGTVKAGSNIELLASAMLEKMIADMKARSVANYRLWGIVTKYKGKNFIFPTYFLALGKIERTKPQQPQQQENIAVNEPNDVLTIPDEIAKRLARRSVITQRRISAEQLRKGLELKQDFILADRTGFILESNQEARFVLDALGRNIQQVSFRLLACETLERAQQKQSAELEQVRFKTAGIVTQYKGRHYLLLQRARRAYSHGNFKN